MESGQVECLQTFMVDSAWNFSGKYENKENYEMKCYFISETRLFWWFMFWIEIYFSQKYCGYSCYLIPFIFHLIIWLRFHLKIYVIQLLIWIFLFKNKFIIIIRSKTICLANRPKFEKYYLCVSTERWKCLRNLFRKTLKNQTQRIYYL